MSFGEVRWMTPRINNLRSFDSFSPNFAPPPPFEIFTLSNFSYFFSYLRFQEESRSESFSLVNFRARKRRNDAQPIKIPSGRSSSIFPTRSRLTSADRIKFQPRSVAGVIVSAFTPRDGELILRFDRGNKIRTAGQHRPRPQSTTTTTTTLFSRRKVDEWKD